jgi:hypothetical protein
VNAFIDGVTYLDGTLDGVGLPNLFRYRAQSPRGGFVLTLKSDNNFFAAPAGNYIPAVSDGYYLFLTPLSRGKHRLHFRALIGDPAQPSFFEDVTYHLTVAPRHDDND